jgi:hydroxymethylbilane synthase
VHSAKDVETQRPAAFHFPAFLPRADRRDCLVGAASIAAIPQGAVVGTSAPRRAAQLLNLRPDCRVVMFRGNVATRLGKLAAGEADVTFLAAAGLERLDQREAGVPLAVEEWIPAAAQGVIAIECLAGNAAVTAALAALDHAPTRAEITAERALLAALGGTCHSPVAALCEGEGETLAMRAALFSPDGALRVEARARFAAGDVAAVQALAAQLLEQAPPGIAEHFRLG